MRKQDTEEKDLLPILKVVFIILLILCALLLSVFLLVWTAKRTDSKKETFWSESVERESTPDIPETSDKAQNAESLDDLPNSNHSEELGEENSPDTSKESESVISEDVDEDNDLGMIFAEVKELVTAKNATNLRDIPSQGEDSTILLTLQNGQTATRIGISETGWSKLEYNGELCYAVSSLLTTDLTVKPQEEQEPQKELEEPEDDGIKTVFTECNEKVCPKIEVNLRTLPSVTDPNSQVVVTIRHGDIVNRTGINTDVGWSRVEYGEQVLYCVSSYVYVVEE